MPCKIKKGPFSQILSQVMYTMYMKIKEHDKIDVFGCSEIPLMLDYTIYNIHENQRKNKT